jgi:three-Cys-motif partner protein
MNHSNTPLPDALPISEVGGWIEDKHLRLKHYVAISAFVRAKFTAPGKAGATYIDLYCGPGRSRRRDTGEIVDGSALVAAVAAEDSHHPFSHLYIADMNAESVKATGERLQARGISSGLTALSGNAHETAYEVAALLPHYAFHLIFLDPFSLGALPLTVIKAFAHFPHADILMHVSAMDLQRNLEQAIDSAEIHQFDIFAPGWREWADPNQPPHNTRRAILSYWANLVRSMGFLVFEDQFTLIRGPRNQPLYWLALATKHERGAEFWDKIRNISPQTTLQF